MTFLQLRCFISLAERLCFSTAAKSLYISQTAVTYHIQALEKELNVPLFRRSTRKVELTAAGHQFYKDIHQAVQNIDAARDRIQALSRKKVFTFSYSSLCTGNCFHQIIADFSTQHPDVTLLLNDGEPENGLLEQLETGQSDAALFINPFPNLPDTLQTLDFGPAPRVALMSHQHALASASAISADQIPASELLISQGIDRIEHQSNLPSAPSSPIPDAAIHPKNFESLFSMIQANLGIAILPMLEGLERSGLVCLPVREATNTGFGPRLTLAWRSSDGSPLVEDFTKIASRRLTSYLSDYRKIYK